MKKFFKGLLWVIVSYLIATLVLAILSVIIPMPDLATGVILLVVVIAASTYQIGRNLSNKS